MTRNAQIERQELFTQILALALIILAFLYTTSQLTNPYVAHDDWDFLVPDTWGLSYSSPWEKTLSEGRWLSYLWYQASVHLTPQSSFPIFAIVYFSLVCAITRQASEPRLFTLCGAAIFFSPMMGQLSLWPTGIICGIALCAAATWLTLKTEHDRYLVFITFISTLLLVLTYPPLATIVLLTVALKKFNAPIKVKISLGAAYVIGFAAGTLLIYILNWIFHDHFGVKVAGWRTPRTPHGLVDLLSNTTLYVEYWRELLREYTIAIVCGTIATISMVQEQEARKKVGAIFLATSLVCGMELGITMVAGTAMPTRSAIWLWIAPCYLCVAAAASASARHRIVGTTLLLVLALSGANHWWNIYQRTQPIAEYETLLASQIHQYEAITSIHTVEVMGDPTNVAEFKSAKTENIFQALQMSMRERFGIRIERCSMELCLKAKNYIASHQDHSAPLMVIDGKLLLVFDRNGKGGIYERNFPNTQEEANLRLGYLPFLPYGPTAVRLTPLFPGHSNRPLSIKLASNLRGYTLQFEGNACSFPVDYELKNPGDSILTKGSLISPEVAALPGWDDQTGIAILTLRMTHGAENNYGCNIIVAAK